MDDESSKVGSAWNQIRKQVFNNNAKLDQIKIKLDQRTELSLDDCVLLGILLSEDQARQSGLLSERMIDLTAKTVDLQQQTIGLSKKMVQSSNAVAILTAVLALAALADIFIRIFCR